MSAEIKRAIADAAVKAFENIELYSRSASSTVFKRCGDRLFSIRVTDVTAKEGQYTFVELPSGRTAVARVEAEQ